MLSENTICLVNLLWWALLGSNQGPSGYEPVALTTELRARLICNTNP